MRVFVALVLLSVFVASIEAEYKAPHPYDANQVLDLWAGWKKKNNKTFAHGDELKHLVCFIENLGRIEELNAHSKTAKFGLTIFADQCFNEWKKTHGGLLKAPDFSKINGSKLVDPMVDYPWAKYSKKADGKVKGTAPSPPPPSPPADFVDYRTWGVLREPVQDQGTCGASAYFASTVMLEAASSLWLDYNVTLSAQELIDCTDIYPYDNAGCDGGLMDINYNYIRDEGGIATESQYPYIEADGTCQQISNKPVGIYMWSYFQPYESMYKQAVYAGGPISIALAALGDANFMLYESGILDNCVSNNVDSGLVAVGYNTAASTPYWIIRNVWGPSWGYDGYMYLEYGTNECGILEYSGMQAIVELN